MLAARFELMDETEKPAQLCRDLMQIPAHWFRISSISLSTSLMMALDRCIAF